MIKIGIVAGTAKKTRVELAGGFLGPSTHPDCGRGDNYNRKDAGYRVATLLSQPAQETYDPRLRRPGGMEDRATEKWVLRHRTHRVGGWPKGARELLAAGYPVNRLAADFSLADS